DTALTRALGTITRIELEAPDITVRSFVGMLESNLAVPSSGNAVFCITIALEGSGQSRIDGVEPLDLETGMAAVFWSDGPVSGFDQIYAGNIEAVEIRLRTDKLREEVGDFASLLRNTLLVDRSDPSSTTILVGIPLTAALIDAARGIIECAVE